MDFYGVFNILSDFESLWYMIHEYMVLCGVYGVFMVYFITFVYSISAPWQVSLDKKFLESWGFYGFFNILSDFESLWYMIHEYMVLWGVYGVFMVYFITFVYSLCAPWQLFLHKKFSDSWVFQCILQLSCIPSLTV